MGTTERGYWKYFFKNICLSVIVLNMRTTGTWKPGKGRGCRKAKS